MLIYDEKNPLCSPMIMYERTGVFRNVHFIIHTHKSPSGYPWKSVDTRTTAYAFYEIITTVIITLRVRV